MSLIVGIHLRHLPYDTKAQRKEKWKRSERKSTKKEQNTSDMTSSFRIFQSNRFTFHTQPQISMHIPYKTIRLCEQWTHTDTQTMAHTIRTHSVVVVESFTRISCVCVDTSVNAIANIYFSVTMTRLYFQELIYDSLKRLNAIKTTTTMSTVGIRHEVTK